MSFPLSRLRGQRGLTLLEILIVISLIGILAAIAIPSGSRASEAYRVAEQGRKLHAEIARLRARAVAERRAVRVSLENGATFALLHDDGGAFVEERRIELPETLTATIDGEQSGEITFLPAGRVELPGTVEISDGSRIQRIRILASGLTRWETEGS